MARRDPARAAEAVYACLRQDHRWDRQVDDRTGYLARLVLDLALDRAPIIAGMYATGDGTDDPDSEFDLSVDVLAELGAAGDDQAVAALRTYVAEGRHWVAVLQSLTWRWPRAQWDDLDTVALARLSPEDEAVLWIRNQPWAAWADRHPGLAGLARAASDQRAATREKRRGSPRTKPERPGNDSLLAVLTDPAESRSAKGQALRELARSEPEPRLLDLVEGLFFTPCLYRAVSRLGTAVVERARRWADDDEMGWFGSGLLAEHGTEQDIPRLLTAWDRVRDTGEWCGYDTLADGFARFGAAAADAAPRLLDMWHGTPHSYERAACLRALVAVAPQLAAGPLTEGLLDCEPGVRAFAVARTPVDDLSAVLLAGLRDDPIETPESRQAAAARLTSG